MDGLIFILKNMIKLFLLDMIMILYDKHHKNKLFLIIKNYYNF